MTREDIEELKEIFVTRQECDEKNDALQEGQHNIDKRLAVIEALQDRQYQITKMVLGAVISTAVGLIAAAIYFAIQMGAV